jgi:hypothetical protein
MNRPLPCISSWVLLLALGFHPGLCESFNDWLNRRIQEQVVADLDKTNGATKQTETPSASENSSSLVDQSSAADLFSAALNQSGLSVGGKSTADSGSATATMYALYAAFRGADPLNPSFYNKKESQTLRRFSLTLGVDQEGEGEEEKTTKLYGLKGLIYDRRHLTPEERKDLDQAVVDAAFARGDIGNGVRAYLFTRPSMREVIRQEYQAFLDKEDNQAKHGCLEKEDPEEPLIDKVERLLSRQFDAKGIAIGRLTKCEKKYFSDEWEANHAGGSFDSSVLSDEDLGAIDNIIRDNLPSLEALPQKSHLIVDRVRKAPQLAFVVTYKELPSSDRAYIGEATYDYGLLDRLTLTANAAYQWTEQDGSDNRKHSWKVASQLRYQLTSATLTRKAMYFDFAGEASRDEMETTYKLQLKTSVPVMAGIAIPVSLTYASNSKLIQEDEIRGQLGFSIDVSKLVESLRVGSPLGGGK